MIAMIGGLALGAAKTLVLSMMTEKMILKFTFMLLEWVVKLAVPHPFVKPKYRSLSKSYGDQFWKRSLKQIGYAEDSDNLM